MDQFMASRFNYFQNILNHMKKKMPIILFKDKKYFTLNPNINSHTNGCIAQGEDQGYHRSCQVGPKH